MRSSAPSPLERNAHEHDPTESAQGRLYQSGTLEGRRFRSFRTMHSSLMCSRVRDNMGHANIDVTQNVYGKNWWEERVDALTRAVEALSAATQNAEKAEAKP